MQTNHFTAYLSIEGRAVVLCNKGRVIARFTNPDIAEQVCKRVLELTEKLRENTQGRDPD